MEHGDLSNEPSLRVMVTYDAVTQDAVTTKTFLGFKTSVETRRVFDPVTLNRLWGYTQRLPISLELVNFGVSDQVAAARLEQLDSKYVNPFSRSYGWIHVDELVEALTYRPDVLGVIDIDERQARYGHRGMDMDYLARVL